MRTYERLAADPHPECEHFWVGQGTTTICDPPIFHTVCPICRTFRAMSPPYDPAEDRSPAGDWTGWKINYSLEWFSPEFTDGIIEEAAAMMRERERVKAVNEQAHRDLLARREKWKEKGQNP